MKIGFNRFQLEKTALYLFLLSFLLRICWWHWIEGLSLLGDERFYWTHALGRSPYQSLLRPPLWSLVLHIPAAFVSQAWAGRLFSILLGSITPVMLYFLSKSVFDKKVGLFAALLLVFYPDHIAFSHYLWAENLFSFLCIATVYFFFEFIKDPENNSKFYLSAVLGSLALLTKEFSVIPFLGFQYTLLVSNITNKVKKIVVFAGIFIAPTLFYVLLAWSQHGEMVNPYYAVVGNFRQAVHLSSGLDPTPLNKRDTLTKSYWAELKEQSLSDRFGQFRKNFYKLWSPNSFLIKRMLIKKVKKGGYGTDSPWMWIPFLVLIHVGVIATGLIGLFLAPPSAFRNFSFCNLIALSLMAAVAYLVSRFRVPFAYIFLMYSSYLCVNFSDIKVELKEWSKTVPLFFFLIVFVVIVRAQLLQWTWGN